MSCPPARDLSIIQFFIGKWPEVVRVMCERVGGVDSPITDGSESSSSGDIEAGLALTGIFKNPSKRGVFQGVATGIPNPAGG